MARTGYNYEYNVVTILEEIIVRFETLLNAIQQFEQT